MVMFNHFLYIMCPLTFFSLQVRNLAGFTIDVIVSLVGSDKLLCCSCDMFEFFLIPYCHLIAFFNHCGVMKLANEFVVE